MNLRNAFLQILQKEIYVILCQMQVAAPEWATQGKCVQAWAHPWSKKGWPGNRRRPTGAPGRSRSGARTGSRPGTRKRSIAASPVTAACVPSTCCCCACACQAPLNVTQTLKLRCP